jgi:hypothetical protein
MAPAVGHAETVGMNGLTVTEFGNQTLLRTDGILARHSRQKSFFVAHHCLGHTKMNA